MFPAVGRLIGVSDMILQLQLAETSQLDERRLAEIAARLGAVGADDMISRGMEDLAVQLARIHKAYLRGNASLMEATLTQICDLAFRLGMPGLLRVARDVGALMDRSDDPALAATVARLGRIGESSLMQVWDIRDLSG